MAHLGWISGAVGVVVGYVGETLATFYGHAGKYSFDKANEVKELIVTARRFISDFEDPPTNLQAKVFLEMACGLKTCLELIRGYGFTRLLRLVRLSSRQNVVAAAEFLPQLAQGIQWSHSISREEADSVRRKILKLLE